ncbi:MAG: DUF1616 domain-containing protein [Bacteroidota bacterium]
MRSIGSPGLKFRETILDLLIVIIWTILTLAFVLTPFLEGTFFRTILGIPMVLFFPGYVLIAMLFPGKDGLEIVERIALSLGLSIAVVPILGLLLNFTFGIRLIPILLTLCTYTIVMSLVAAWRRGKLPADERFFFPIPKISEIVNNELHGTKGKTDKILTGILIITLFLAIGIIFFVVTTPKVGERFTEFYILDPSGKTGDYPVNLKFNFPDNVKVGIINHEYALINYSIQVKLDDNILTGASIGLNHNDTWEKNMTFIPDKEGTNMKLGFLLFNSNNVTEPYRELHLWVNVTK